VGVEYIILGHSERREHAGESNELLAAKVDSVISGEITPIFCCGESLEIREAGTEIDFVSKQLTESLFHLSAEDIQKVVIAYEPIWAIGTGKTATSQQAQDMHAALRAHLASKYGQEIADEISILYGGSVKAANATELFGQPDVDGGLVGGASLKSREFVEIVKSMA
ncbi:MAG: triose-phosphate isomerase, partial [Bacteroidota bacterium]